jgi:4-hydroxyphenylpyruvate dioxygenase
MAPSAEPRVLTSTGEVGPIAGAKSVEAAKITTIYRGYGHVQWYVGNVKQAAAFYVLRMRFQHVAYRGLETGSRSIASHVVQNGNVRFVLTSPLRSGQHLNDVLEDERELLTEIQEHLLRHGDAVKDVAFEVDNVNAVWSKAVAAKAVSVQRPHVIEDPVEGPVLLAKIKTYRDTTHTLVQRSTYHGVFMPGYQAVKTSEPMAALLPGIDLEAIDHCVGNQDWDEREKACQ